MRNTKKWRVCGGHLRCSQINPNLLVLEL